MWNRRVLVVAALALAVSAPGPASQTPPSSGEKTAPPEGPLELYQIDLVPTGSGFAVTKPVLEGDVYVFQVWPDRATVRLPKSKVKNMVSRTKDVNAQVAYQIDLAPSGQIFARDNPTLKGTSYQFHRWRGGALMSVRKSDVQKITRVAGLDAFRLYLKLFGAKPIDNLAMQGGTATMAPGAPAPGSDPAISGQPTNWLYFGVPGVSDAWAPPSAVVGSPGDVPKAAEPQPPL
jgi:hypothetical protein